MGAYHSDMIMKNSVNSVNIQNGQYRAKPNTLGRCNDYPEREYNQVVGSAEQLAIVEEIVYSIWEHIAVRNRTV